MVAAAPLPTDDELACLNLFRSVDVATVRPRLLGCSVRHLQSDEILIHAAQPNDRLYLLLSGAVSIHLNHPDNPPIVVLGAGETIGELSLIDKQPTSAFAVAQTACQVRAHCLFMVNSCHFLQCLPGYSGPITQETSLC